jgi:DNA-binding transcriptional regulator of glucitol operon
MKRYVSLAGAILVGTVVAKQQKSTIRSVVETKLGSAVKKLMQSNQEVAEIKVLECLSESDKQVETRVAKINDVDEVTSNVTSNVTSDVTSNVDTDEVDSLVTSRD